MDILPDEPTGTMSLFAEEAPARKFTVEVMGGEVDDPAGHTARKPDEPGPAAVTTRLAAVALRGIPSMPATAMEMKLAGPGAAMAPFAVGRFSPAQ